MTTQGGVRKGEWRGGAAAAASLQRGIRRIECLKGFEGGLLQKEKGIDETNTVIRRGGRGGGGEVDCRSRRV